MSYLKIEQAVKGGGFARVALIGPPGCGKSLTALRMAKGMANGGKIGAIDTEKGSLRKYAGKATKYDVNFSDIRLSTFAPSTYVEAINEFAKAGFKVLIIDSASHAWSGKDGALEQVNTEAARSQSKNSYIAWKDVTPQHNEFVNAMLGYPGHLIVTMRSKVEYVIEKDDKDKMQVRKIGTTPIQRADTEYEFDIAGEMDQDNNLIITKTRADFLNRAVINKPDEEFGAKIARWAEEGVVEPLPFVQPDSILRPIAMIAKEKGVTSEFIMNRWGKSPKNMSNEELEQFMEWLNNVQTS